MGLDTIPNRTGGQTIIGDFWNTLKSVLGVDIVPRNSSGVVTDKAGAIGTSTYRFLSAFAEKYNLGAVASGLSIEEVSGSIVFKVGGVEKLRIASSALTIGSGVDLNDNSITRDALKNDPVYNKSTTAANFSTTSTSYVDVTNANVTITKTGKPVLLMFEGEIRMLGTTSDSLFDGGVKLFRGATELKEWTMRLAPGGTPGGTYQVKVPADLGFLDTDTGTGSETYKLQAAVNNVSGHETIYVTGKLVAIEL